MRVLPARTAARRAARCVVPRRKGPRVLRRASRRRVLHPHQRPRPQLPARARAGGRPVGRATGSRSSRIARWSCSSRWTSSATSGSPSSATRGLVKLRVTDFASGKRHYIAFDEAVYSAHSGTNAEFDTEPLPLHLREPGDAAFGVRLRSAHRQRARCSSASRCWAATIPAQYVSEALTAVAKDGTRIPISLVYKKALRGRAPQPLLLYGYGSYGIPIDPYFRCSRISLLDRGMIFAIAHVRGGGDRGKLWYDAGKLLEKKNTFTDFIACAESLMRRRYTAPDRLVIQGGSAGGLLMGAVVNVRPDLFKAVVLAGAVRRRGDHDARPLAPAHGAASTSSGAIPQRAALLPVHALLFALRQPEDAAPIPRCWWRPRSTTAR